MHPFINIGFLRLPTYGLCMAAGFVIAALLGYVRAKRRGVDVYDYLVVIASAAAMGILGTKLLYMFVSYGVDRIIADIRAGEWTFITDSGQVYLGGLFGGVLGGFIGTLIIKGSFAQYCDIIIPMVPLGHAFGRLGCHLGGCCYGRPYDGFCSVSYPLMGVDYGVFPVQLTEMALNLVVFAALLLYMRRERRRFAVLWMYMLMYSVERFGLEYLRGDAIRGIAAGLSTSQWISIIMFICSVIMLSVPALKTKSKLR